MAAAGLRVAALLRRMDLAGRGAYVLSRSAAADPAAADKLAGLLVRSGLEVGHVRRGELLVDADLTIVESPITNKTRVRGQADAREELVKPVCHRSRWRSRHPPCRHWHP